MTVIQTQPKPTVHVHIVPLCVPAHEVDLCRILIAPEERQRADRFRNATHASRWAVSRARLRQVLGMHLDADPCDVSFVEGLNGKPMLGGMRQGMHFNLSHSEDLALIAVSDDVEVGIDVEHVHELSDLPAVARRVFTQEEQDQIFAADPEMTQKLFYRGWTRKEAIIKATGEGLSADLNRIAVSLGDDAELLECPDGDPSGWNLLHIDPEDGYVGALATRTRIAPAVLVYRDEVYDQLGGREVA